MLAVRCPDWRRYQDCVLQEIPLPEPGPGQVRIATHYAGVSFATSLMTEGRYQRKPSLPFTPGTEVAGEINGIGPGVTGFALGDRVCAGVDWGGHAEAAVIDSATVYRIPDALPYRLAPQFPLSYSTAYGALVWRARLQPAETVLVHGSAGAVGLAAVEIAAALGARVIATASTEAKCALARAHGAAEAVIFPGNEALDRLRAAAPSGFDVAFDPVGGDAFDLALRVMAPGGRILVIGFAAGRIQQIPANILLVKDVTVHGYFHGRFTGWGRVDERRRYEPMLREAFATMFDWVEQGRLRPETSHVFALADFPGAMDAVLSRQGLGKIVLEMPVARRPQ
jgi:NADPH2:quinone reductase